MQIDINLLQEKISYFFKNPNLLHIALTHRSYLREKLKDPNISENNERLEFLGDAVLELIITELLYKHKNDGEGLLTTLRSSLVNKHTLAKIGNTLGLNEQIYMSRAEQKDEGKGRLTIIADAMEAIIGAIYLDGGYRHSKVFIENYIWPELSSIEKQDEIRDAKTRLQEAIQKKLKITPKYKTLSSIGKDHQKIFECAVFIDNKMYAKALGQTKQIAETKAAERALIKFKKKLD